MAPRPEGRSLPSGWEGPGSKTAVRERPRNRAWGARSAPPGGWRRRGRRGPRRFWTEPSWAGRLRLRAKSSGEPSPGSAAAPALSPGGAGGCGPEWSSERWKESCTSGPTTWRVGGGPGLRRPLERPGLRCGALGLGPGGAACGPRRRALPRAGRRAPAAGLTPAFRWGLWLLGGESPSRRLVFLARMLLFPSS